MQKINEKFPGIKVLVADDYPINLELTQEMLEMMECMVDSAEDGIQAVKLCNDNEYDVIFMDVQMPNMDGYKATKEIRKSGNGNSKTVIIAITANAMAGDKEKCLDAGMDDYISKPIKGKNIEDMLIKYIRDKK
ncbi:MAG: histidine kinase [Alphaproteobacteria bacterium CG11_big_fil_rev_8_21_14_0_20_39_49]|nr:MAG: histidine kinase [Alphaproteobacteria bacterium CG11_big_fil_rev_8_21_14_0_20_39_49]